MDLELSVATPTPSPSRGDRDRRVVLAVRGECDLTNAHVLRERLLALAEGQTPRVILDLTGLNFIDSSGITALVVGDRRARALGGGLVLAGARQIVARVFALTALDEHFPMFATVAEALADGEETAGDAEAAAEDGEGAAEDGEGAVEDGEGAVEDGEPVVVDG